MLKEINVKKLSLLEDCKLFFCIFFFFYHTSLFVILPKRNMLQSQVGAVKTLIVQDDGYKRENGSRPSIPLVQEPGGRDGFKYVEHLCRRAK